LASVDEKKAIADVVEKSKGVWLLTHETTRERLDPIMEDGIVPEYRDFRGVQDRVTFATDAKDGDFRNIRKRTGGTRSRNSAYVLFERPEGVEHVFQFLARRNPEEIGKIIAQGAWTAMKDWFVTTKVIGPENVAIIYRFDGQVLYFREALSQ
jgi:hypothetical protein